MTSEKDSIICIIKGGLGNQLFTYAAGYACARRTRRAYFIDWKRGFSHDSYGRSYRLARFPISASEMPEAWRVAPTLKHLRHKLVRALNKHRSPDRKTYVAQRWDMGPEQLLDFKPSKARVLLNGYWADEGYFRDCAEDIRREFRPPAPEDERNRSLGERFAADGNLVFVHARRVRYPMLLPLAYYAVAIEKVRAVVAQPRFVVFSDDMDWAREHLDFSDSPVEWVDHNGEDELADFWLMTQCRHAIIANSSFSWWGAWLGAPLSAGRIICAPKSPDWLLNPAEGWEAIPFIPE
jgi:hypothetical protein